MYSLSSRSPAHPTGTSSRDAYAVSAEFYDVLQGEADAAQVRELYGTAVGSARHGVLDIGAGTGRVTLLGLAESEVGVHAVEPARSMRSALMTRLASLPAEVRGRVTVHPCTLDEARLRGVADIAVCHNTLACLDPSSRRRLYPAVAEALSPGGLFLLHLPPANLPRTPTVRPLPPQRLGRHEYGGHMVLSAEAGRIRTRFDYWVRDGTDVVREHTETFWMWPASRDDVAEELAEHGFTPVPDAGDPAVLTVRRE
ncbi:class I SAM-dependent methyltransferase [Streptomyces sp. NBC_00696]|uniref:class I SAM-dependent methyltransferase n=1 Tax=Streptomyces sp. NBC_00696 TaxID=2903672 RepID=UPI002E3304B0|nr:class I SAM-dependent methyltransferase [Streptomyces sp. NBC_00696]